MDSVLSIDDVRRASELLDTPRDDALAPDLDALRGHLTELTARRGHPQLTLAVEHLAATHRHGEPAAWIGGSNSLLYPVDADGWNLDWSALAVIRLAGPNRAARAADRLLRSGAFGLVVVDLVGLDDLFLPDALTGRLLRLADTHDSAVLFLTRSRRSSPSLSSMIALRIRARWDRTDAARLRLSCTVTKDKRRGPGRAFEEVYDGPLGLR